MARAVQNQELLEPKPTGCSGRKGQSCSKNATLTQEADETATNAGDALHQLFNDYGPCLILIDECIGSARQLHDAADGAGQGPLVAQRPRGLVEPVLSRYGYRPDKQEKATQTVLEQAEVFPAEWAAA